MSAFDLLVDDLAETARRKESRSSEPWLPKCLITPSIASDTKLMKALDDLTRLHNVTSASAALEDRKRQVEKVEDIRQRARELIRTTDAQLKTAVADGRMTAVEVSAASIFLERFARKMGL